MRLIAVVALAALLCSGCSGGPSEHSSEDVRAVAEWLVMQERMSAEVIDRLQSPSEMYPTDEDDSPSDLMINIEMSIRAMREECKKARARTERMRPDFKSPTTLAALDDFARSLSETEEELAGCVTLIEEIDGSIFGLIEHESEIMGALVRVQHTASALLEVEAQKAQVVEAARRLLRTG